MAAALDRLDDRLNAIEAALTTALPTRVIKRAYYRHVQDQAPADLDAGVVMLVSSGESGYRKGVGLVAREGTQDVLLVCHLRVAETASPQDIEAAEIVLIEEIKSFVRAGVAGMTLLLDRVQHSRQQAHPYGWVVATLQAAPPGSNVY